MHKLRPTTARRGIGVHLVRIAAFSAAFTALGGIVVADVLGADLDEPTAMALLADGPFAVDLGPVLLAAAVVVPDALTPAAPALDDLIPPPELEPPKKKRRRAGKLKFGRFEGY